MEYPLSDVRVVDCGQVIAGPLCACFMADLGADVVKVEPPDGELFRPEDATGEEYDGARTIDGEPFSPSFELYNRNKRGLTLDLKRDRGREVMYELLDDADVFVQNWPPGVAGRLGLGWETLHERNPGLVYAHVTGYGETGPLAEYPGMDTIAQHISGFSSMLGYDDDRPPIRSQSSLADYMAAFSALSSALAALYHRDVHDAGGQKIDVSLLEALVHNVDGAFEIYNNQGEVPRPGGRNAYSSPDMLYGAARAADGWVCVALLLFSDRVWEAYCDLLDRPDLREAEKYRDRAGRMDDAAKLSAIFEEWLAERPVREAVDTLNDAGIPAAKHNDIGEAAELDHMAAREVFQAVEHPTFQELTLTSSPLSLSETGIEEPEHAPRLGADTREVLVDAGYDDEEVEALAEDGLI